MVDRKQTTLFDSVNSEEDTNNTTAKKETKTESGSYGFEDRLPRMYLDYQRGVRIAENSVSTIASRLRLFEAFLHKNDVSITDAGFSDIDDFMRECVRQGNRGETLKAKKSSIKELYKYIVVRTNEDPDISAVEIDQIDVSEYNTPEAIQREALTDEEIQILFDNLNETRNRLIVFLHVVTGLRNAEVRDLRIDDIDFDDLTIHVRNPKYGNSYDATMTQKLALKLKHWVKSDRKSMLTADQSDYLFPSNHSNKLQSNYSTNKIIKQAAERGGIQKIIGKSKIPKSQQDSMNTDKEYRKWYKVTVHALRHTFVTKLDQAGAPVEVQRDAANHRSSDTTENYRHTEDDKRHKLVRELLSDLDNN